MKNTVLITGGSQRIGKIICQIMAKEGWNIAIHFNKSEKKTKELSSSLKKYNIKTACIKADLSKEKELKNLFSKARKSLGPINCLINNVSTFEIDSIDNINKKKWNYHMSVNLWAPIFLIKEFKKNLLKRTKGNIINIVDQRVLNLTPFFTTYTLTKSSLWTLTKTLAMALAPNIRVNAIGPGPTFASKRQTKKKFEKQWKSTLLNKPVDAKEIADAILFILNSKSITGHLIPIDSGQHLGWAQASNKNILNE